MELTPNTYTPPLRLYAGAAWRKSWVAWVFFVLVFAVTVAISLDLGIGGEGVWAMYALSSVVLAISAYASIWGYRRGALKYQIRGITFLFSDRSLYVPPGHMEDFIEENVCSKFRPHTQTEPWELLDGVAVHLVSHDLKLGDHDAFGMTYPRNKYSLVEADRVLDAGVMGWELKLQIMQRIFPGQSEALDIKWIRAKGI